MNFLKTSILVLSLAFMVFGQKPQVVFKTDWGSAVGEIGLRQAPDARYAAQSFRVSADTVSILDGQNGQLKLFKSSRFLQAIPVSPQSRDFISIDPGSFTILSDRNIYNFSSNKQGRAMSIERGHIIQSIQELPGMIPTLCFSDGLSQNLKENMAVRDNPVKLHKLNGSYARITIDSPNLQTAFELNFPQNNLASLQLAGIDAQNHIFIQLEFFLSQVPLRVERQVRVYTQEGKHLLTYGLALNDYTLIFRDLFVDFEGNLYQMIQLPEGLKILKWPWSNEQTGRPIEWQAPEYNWEPSESDEYTEPASGQLFKLEDLPDVTPETALAIGDTYDKLNWTCTSDNLTNGTITDSYGNHVQTPDWLYVGSVNRVPYKWGGFNTINGFLDGIASGKYAGDKATDSVSPEAVGVDCSGFVSRCWTLPSHYSTRMMDDYITQPYDSWEQTQPGDACHKVGHVRLIVGHRQDGSLDMVESAGFNWRVSYTNYRYSQITSYTPRYYINMQGTPGNIPQPSLSYVTADDHSHLSWALQSSDQISQVCIKSSADGSFIQEETYVPVDSLTFSEFLADSQAVYYELNSISAANASIESLPSDTYGIYRNDRQNKILIVDGFDRISATTGSWDHTYHSFAATHGRALQALNIPFETASNDAVQEGLLDLSNYRAVIWICGDESTVDETFNSDEQALVSEYLTQGGQLFVSGSEIGWDLDHKGSAEDKAFYNNYLKAGYVEDDAGAYAASGETGSFFDGLSIHYDDGTHGVYQEDYPDVVKTLNGSSVALKYSNGKVAAISYEGLFGNGTQSGRLFYLAFPFETIYNESERIGLMSRVTDFFQLTTGITAESKPIIRELALYGNYPNPFNGQTQIRFYLPAPGRIKISVFDIRGRILFQDDQYLTEGGERQIPINANQWASGVYVYELLSETSFGRQRASGKIVLVK